MGDEKWISGFPTTVASSTGRILLGALILRVNNCVRYLAEGEQASKEDSHEIDNPHNGNYLGGMDLLAMFDTFLFG